MCIICCTDICIELNAVCRSDQDYIIFSIKPSQCNGVKHTTVNTATSAQPTCVLSAAAQTITACALATSCCTSDVPCQWQGQNFNPHSSHIFQPIFLKLKSKKDIRDMQNLVDVGRREGICKGSEFWLTFGSFLFCTLHWASRSHRKTDSDQ